MAMEVLHLQLFFQQLRCIGHTTSTLAEDHTRTDALEHLALGGTIALLELGHDLSHAFSCGCLIFGGHSQDDTRPDECTTSTFHVAHARAEGVAQVTACFFIDSNQISVGTNDALGTVVCAVL